MRAYFLRRLLLIPPTLLGITFVVFLLTRFAPGGPLERMMTEAQAGGGGEGRRASQTGSGTQLSQEQIAQLQAYYGFDLHPVPAYFRWLGKVARGDLGNSTRYQTPVAQMIRERIPVSATYGLAALVLTYAVCLPLGVLKAIRHRTVTDSATSALIFAGYAVPGYALGSLLLVFLAAKLRWFPMSGFVSRDFEFLGPWDKFVDVLHHGVLPVACYVVGGFALKTMLVKNQMLDHLAADYMRTALAKGMPFRRTVFRQALRNALLPVVSTLGQALTVIVSGSVLVETIFDINGFGLMGFSAMLDRDYPIMLGILLVGAVLLLLGNVLSDIFVALLDPRIRFK
jgi:microcin C transport system permease protein